MNFFTRIFAFHFDRSFSGKSWRQLAWLFGVILIIFCSVYIACCLSLSSTSAEQHLFQLICLFIDPGSIKDAIYISAKDNKNIDEIFEEILKKTRLDKINYSELQITNKRQHEALKEAINEIEKITNENIVTLDILDMQIKKIWQKLGEITGETANEAIIDEIFSKFCLGK